MDTDKHTGRTPSHVKAEIGVRLLQAKEGPQLARKPPEARREAGNRGSLTASEGTCQTLGLAFQPPDWDRVFLLSAPPGLCPWPSPWEPGGLTPGRWYHKGETFAGFWQSGGRSGQGKEAQRRSLRAWRRCGTRSWCGWSPDLGAELHFPTWN